MPERRFPAPWTVEEYRGISYIVRDANNFAVAYVYFANEPGRRATAGLMTKDEARKVAAGIAKLPTRWRATGRRQPACATKALTGRRAALIACFAVIQVHHMMDSNDRSPFPQSDLSHVDRRQRRACPGIRRVRLPRNLRPNDADRRNFYKVEKWDAAELHIEALIHASNDLECARAIFASEKNRRPRGRYTLRQAILALLWQIYSRCFSLLIQDRQYGHR